MDAKAALQGFFQPGANLTIERVGPAPDESRPLFRWLRTGLLGAAKHGRAGQAMAWQLPWAQSEPLFSAPAIERVARQSLQDPHCDLRVAETSNKEMQGIIAGLAGRGQYAEAATMDHLGAGPMFAVRVLGQAGQQDVCIIGINRDQMADLDNLIVKPMRDAGISDAKIRDFVVRHETGHLQAGENKDDTRFESPVPASLDPDGEINTYWNESYADARAALLSMREDGNTRVLDAVMATRRASPDLGHRTTPMLDLVRAVDPASLRGMPDDQINELAVRLREHLRGQTMQMAVERQDAARSDIALADPAVKAPDLAAWRARHGAETGRHAPAPH